VAAAVAVAAKGEAAGSNDPNDGDINDDIDEKKK